MDGRLTILYRGPLSSCNYGCPYCPFAKRHETAAQLKEDRSRLDRFVSWLSEQGPQPHSVMFTPWGEALTRSWYRDAMIRLSLLPHVDRVVAQTNLSWKFDWLQEADRSSLALWCTYHPGETTRDAFLNQCQGLQELCVSFSVGVVGLKEHQEEIQRLRSALPPDVYLWVNAYKRSDAYYDDAYRDELRAVDPFFPINAVRHASLGKQCRTGASVITVDGDGNVRRCHFVDEVIANIYQPNWRAALQDRVCPNETCGCHIGYVHLTSLRQDRIYGDNILERIPLADSPQGTR